ncbi:MAG: radical SAM protein [Patescibacteria group bacterium]|jgi:radical SAM superfamily enzyme YgiQ (UPF0313 family)
MNTTARVALVYPEVYDLAHFKEKRKEFPPFGVLYLASFLEKNNIEVKIFKTVSGDEQYDFRGYDVVGFSIPASATYNLLKNVRFLARYSKDVVIAVGGVHPSFYPQKTFIDFKADVVAIGCGERTIVDIVNACHDKDFSRVSGVCCFSGQSLVINQAGPLDKDIDWLAFPARHLLDESDFIMNNRLAGTDIRMTHIMLSRGCPFSCRFCAVMQKKLQYRSGVNAKTELEYLKREYQINGFAIVDDNFVVDKRAVNVLCKEIGGLGLAWSALSRVDTVDYELLEVMQDAGCLELKFGIESGSERMLQAMGKNISCNQIRRAITLSFSLGIKVKAFLVHGFPGEDMSSTQETISLLKDIGGMIDRVSLFRFTPLPGSYVFNNASKFGLLIPENIEDWSRFHIYHNNYHWWGSAEDFHQVEVSYSELEKFITDNWQ